MGNPEQDLKKDKIISLLRERKTKGEISITDLELDAIAAPNNVMMNDKGIWFFTDGISIDRFPVNIQNEIIAIMNA